MAAMAAASGPAEGLLLLVRPDCELCEQMSRSLAAVARHVVLPPVAIADVDSNEDWRRRYGLKIPVLLLDGTPVCRTRFDETALMTALTNASRR